MPSSFHSIITTMSSSSRYPIGEFQSPSPILPSDFSRWLNELERLPEQMRRRVRQCAPGHLLKTYRKGGWTVQQLIHHVADSHMNGYIRMKWTLSEDTPTIKPYDEKSWAEMPDSLQLPIENSLELLSSIHTRWTFVLRNLTDQQLERSFIHPDSGKTISLKEHTGMYAWHGLHHLAHVDNALKTR